MRDPQHLADFLFTGCQSSQFSCGDLAAHSRGMAINFPTAEIFGSTMMNRVESSAMKRMVSGGRVSKWSRLAPLLIMEAYLSFTVLLFAFGPWPWPVQNSLTLYTYLILVQIALLLGYLSKSQDDGVIYTGQYSIYALLKVSVILNIIFLIPYFYLQIGPEGLSIQGIISHTIAGATDPWQVYKDKLDTPSVRGNYLLYIYMLSSPILWLAVPLGVGTWRSLSRKMKSAIVLIVLGNAATWIALGTMKGIADDCAIIAISIAATWQRPLPFRRSRMKRGTLKRVVVIVCALSALVSYFAYQRNSRQGGRVIMADPDLGIQLDTNNILIAGLPEALQVAVAGGSTYLTQGYYGLSLALEQPFKWSYGIGHSVALTSIVNKVTGFDAGELTYNAREQDAGWDMQRRWDSIYPWLASDVTFPGTLLIVFLIGRLLASVWADTRSGESPYALPLFVMVMLMIYYFPANDQVLSFNQSFVAFWVLLYLWLSTRRTIRRVGAWN
jgi:hypothetical protein